MGNDRHSWQFFRAGGLDQVFFASGADIERLAELDRKLWVALACPVRGIEFDERTAALIDSDGDGRIRATEILEAVAFLKARLRSLDGVLAGSDALALDAIDDTTDEGRRALASARRILANLGKEGATAIGFADATDPARIGKRFNGDGVVTPESADDPDTAAVIRDILATHGGLADRSGTMGVDAARADAFFADVHALHDWSGRVEAAGGPLPFGADTATVHAAVAAVRTKVDDYFARCRLAAYDPRALTAVNRAETEYLAAAAQDLSVTAQEIAGFPLSRIEPGRPLPLSGAVNPAWADALATLARAIGAGVSLEEPRWRELTARLAPYEQWLAARPVTKVEALGLPRVRAIAGSGARERVAALIARDATLAPEAAEIDAVEKLVRLNRDFARLLQNFVSFGDFYSRKRPATFQAGHLFLDSRECHLCIRVDDAGKHAVLAGLSRCYLAYCDVTRRGSGEKLQILAVITQGDSDYLMVGRNGLFVDRQGRDWDATVTRIVDAPISIRQAFFAPYKKFIRMIEEQVARRAAAAGAASEAQLASGAEQVAHADKAAAAARPPEKKMDLGTIALIGTAISGVAAMVGLVLEKFFGLGVFMPLGILAIVLLFSGPSMLIAALKLRQRSLGPILDASGWAINGRVKVTLPFGTALTSVAALPPGSTLTLSDPYAEKKSPWPKVLAGLAILAAAGYLAWRLGLLP